LNLHRLYLIVSIPWALVAGALAAFAMIAVGAGVAWIFLFGDDPWPAATEWVLPLLGLAAGLVVAIAVVLAISQYGKQAAQSGNPARERRKAVLLLLAPLLLIAIGAVSAWLSARNYSVAMDAVAKREQAFAELVGSLHKVAAVDIMSDPAGINAVIRTNGQRAGIYDLVFQVLPASGNTVLFTDDRSVQLPAGESDLTVTFKMEDVQQAYRDSVLHGGGGVLVDELFRLNVSLAPTLSGEEIASLPPGEVGRVETPDSPLQSRRTARFAVRFTIAK
jgi:hypothetical protein